MIDAIYANVKEKNEDSLYFFVMTCFLIKSIDFTWLYNGGHYRFDGSLFAGYKGIEESLNMNPKILIASLFGLHKARIFAVQGIFVASIA